MKNSFGIYVHIPFCVQKCKYCDFVSYAGLLNSQYSYKDAILKEMDMRASDMENKRISSIFIGGGTPSVTDVNVISDILNAIYKKFEVDEKAEITIEINPGTVSNYKLNAYKSIGINRLSIGLQAWQDELLITLGRVHTLSKFLDTYDRAKKIGFDNINIDIMFGLPKQTISQWIDTLRNVMALKPDHVSCYDLQLEEGTALYNLVAEGDLKLPNEEDDRFMYNLAVDYLKSEGYERYELSNFARSGFECKHNINYWNNGYYIGFGCAAHSHVDNIRWANVASLYQYIKNVHDGVFPLEFIEHLDYDTSMFETIMLGLRTTYGVNKTIFKQKFGLTLDQRYKDVITKLKALGLLIEDKYSIRASDKAMNVLNSILMEFL